MTVIGGIGEFDEHFKCRSSRLKEKHAEFIKGHGVFRNSKK